MGIFMISIGQRGQLSVEYLLLTLVVLIILGAVTIPLIGDAIDASMAVSRVSDAKTAVETISSAADVVYANGPGSKRTIDVYIPQNTNLSTDGKMIGMNITYQDNGETTKFVNSTTNYNLTNAKTPVNNGWYRVTVSWVLREQFIRVDLNQIS